MSSAVLYSVYRGSAWVDRPGFFRPESPVAAKLFLFFFGPLDLFCFLVVCWSRSLAARKKAVGVISRDPWE